MFKRILIANRGEIACRIIQACRELGIETVAVYSQADQNSSHVSLADESVCLGPAQSSASYLQMESILQAALQKDCQAIHPGYGFLAENSLFALLCEQYKITFIGPKASVIRQMGDKSQARQAMAQAGLQPIPGSQGVIRDIQREAEKIGYPLLLKAAYGGGGKGMRICQNSQELKDKFSQASLEAEKAFGNAAIYMEKYISSGRHIEFQVLADHYGNVVHLGERECSIQRNHQKLIEESPSPALSNSLRQQMGERILTAMREIGYTNAGTIEFLMDQQSNLYFMEMNTRLQVEHPVSEMVTGVDIVKEQIKIAANELLSLSQSEISFQGHAIECRINAEDPFDNFRPSPGKITRFAPPVRSEHVRLETHVEENYVIPPFYDSMIAKLVVWEESRDAAIAKMIESLENFQIEGIATTISLHLKILRSEQFRSGDFDTRFLENFGKELKN